MFIPGILSEWWSGVKQKRWRLFWIVVVNVGLFLLAGRFDLDDKANNWIDKTLTPLFGKVAKFFVSEVLTGFVLAGGAVLIVVVHAYWKALNTREFQIGALRTYKERGEELIEEGYRKQHDWFSTAQKMGTWTGTTKKHIKTLISWNASQQFDDLTGRDDSQMVDDGEFNGYMTQTRKYVANLAELIENCCADYNKKLKL